MKAQNTTKSRKLLVKLIDEKGNVFTRIFPVELPNEFDVQNFKVERLELAKEFHKPYSKAISELASNLIQTQISELEKIKILADSTLDSDVKVRFVSDYNASTAKRINAFTALYPKAKAYRAEKGLTDITVEKFLLDFSPIDSSGDKYSPYQYITLSEDQKSHKLNAVKLIDQTSEKVDK